MNRIKRTSIQTYIAAIVISALAVVITEMTVLATQDPLMLRATAVAISAWFGGLGPGIVALVITLGSDILLHFGPTVPLRPAEFPEIVKIVAYVAASLIIIGIAFVRERVEDHLREQRELLQVTLASIGDAVVTTDEQGRVTFLNPVARKLTGWTLDEVQGQPLSDVLHIIDEATEQPIESPVTRVLREGRTIGLSNHSLLVAKDGRGIPIDDSAAPIRDDKGVLGGVVLIFRDISERRGAERAISESEERYRAVTESASDAIITTDPLGKIVFANHAAEEIFGYALDELIGQNLDILIGDEQRGEYRAAMLGQSADGERLNASNPIQLTGVRKDERHVPVEISFGKFVSNNQRYLTNTIRDITERKEAEYRQAVQYAVTRALADSDTLNEAAPKVLQAIGENVDWQVGVMWYIDRKIDLMRCVDTWHTPDLDVSDFEKLTREMLIGKGFGLPGQVWSTNRAQWHADISTFTDLPRAKAMTKYNLHGWLGFPIVSDGEMTGVVEFFSPAMRSPNHNFLQLVDVLGSQIGQFAERKQAEESLKLAREQEAIILEGVSDGITAQDATGHLIYANNAAAQLLGYASRQELLDTSISEVVKNFVVMDESGQPFPLERLPGRLALEGKYPDPVLVRFRVVKTGEERWALVNAAPVLDDRGKVQFAVNIFHDVTERRRTDEGIARLAAIVESSEDAILSKTIDGIVQAWNPGATRLFGYTADEMLGKSTMILYPPERQDEFRHVVESLRRGESVALHDTIRMRKDGTRIDVSVGVSPIKNADGKVIGASSIARDITQRKEAEETQRFLALAGSMMAASLDYKETLATVANLAVPRIADFCAVDMLQSKDHLEMVALAHMDAEKIKLAKLALQRYPPDPQSEFGAHQVVRTGKPILITNITDEQIAAGARDVEHLKLLVELGLKSVMIVPLTARGRALGTLTFVSSRRNFQQIDLELAEELAHRAALFVDNALLYRDAQELNQELEQRVVARTIELQEANQKLKNEIDERKHTAAQLRLLSAHLQSAREEERIRIAREIHDQMGQTLTAIKIDMSLLSKRLRDNDKTSDRQVLADEAAATIKLVDETIHQMRHIIQELRPEILDHLGLRAAIEWQVQEFQTRTGMRCLLNAEIDDSQLDIDRSTAIFRILQESLTNVARHSNATAVDIHLREEHDKIILEIHDNGKGIIEGKPSGQKSFGILGMRERAYAFGGEVNVHSVPGDGTTVIAHIPISLSEPTA